jgi:hypothetical protein
VAQAIASHDGQILPAHVAREGLSIGEHD